MQQTYTRHHPLKIFYSLSLLFVNIIGTNVPIHYHPNSNENILLICGKLVEIIYDDNGNEVERIHLDPSRGNFGCVVPAGAWHTIEVLEPSVIYEAKDGKYGEDGSMTLEKYKQMK